MLWWNDFASKKHQPYGVLLKVVLRSQAASQQHFDMVAYSRFAPKVPTDRAQHEVCNRVLISRYGGGPKLLADLRRHLDQPGAQSLYL
jgi:hypothetical protein